MACKMAVMEQVEKKSTLDRMLKIQRNHLLFSMRSDERWVIRITPVFYFSFWGSFVRMDFNERMTADVPGFVLEGFHLLSAFCHRLNLYLLLSPRQIPHYRPPELCEHAVAPDF